MINLEFSNDIEIKEALDTVRTAVDLAIFKEEKTAEFEFQGKEHTIDIKSDIFNIGMLYGLSMAKDCQNVF